MIVPVLSSLPSRLIHMEKSAATLFRAGVVNGRHL
jgi:hypothetical protein